MIENPEMTASLHHLLFSTMTHIYCDAVANHAAFFGMEFDKYLKLVSVIFYQIFIFHQIITLQKLWNIFFISSEKLFSFSRYSNFCISALPSFFPVSNCFRGWSRKILKAYDIISCLNKNLATHFVWYLQKEIRRDIETLSIDRVLNKEHFYGEIMQKMYTKS